KHQTARRKAPNTASNGVATRQLNRAMVMAATLDSVKRAHGRVCQKRGAHRALSEAGLRMPRSTLRSHPPKAARRVCWEALAYYGRGGGSTAFMDEGVRGSHTPSKPPAMLR
ncbi:hypothetical protein IWW57_004846, partial [Coemansia sp. S610]